MKARAADRCATISQRLSDILCGREGVPALTEPMVLVADDLTPSETVALDKNNILAFVTRQGSANSHTAILARIMNIPSLVQADVPSGEKLHGRMIAVDGFTGEYFLDPDEATVARLREKRRADTEQRRALDAVRGLPSVTKSGRQVRLYANIGGPEDVPAVLFNDAEGVGLFRSEFLYLGRDDYPSEDEQFEAYRKAAEPRWAASLSSSARSTSARIRRPITLAWRVRKTPRSALGRSVSAWSGRSCSRHSFARSTARPLTAR